MPIPSRKNMYPMRKMRSLLLFELKRIWENRQWCPQNKFSLRKFDDELHAVSFSLKIRRVYCESKMLISLWKQNAHFADIIDSFPQFFSVKQTRQSWKSPGANKNHKIFQLFSNFLRSKQALRYPNYSKDIQREYFLM